MLSDDWVQKRSFSTFSALETFAYGLQCNKRTLLCISVSGFCCIFELYHISKKKKAFPSRIFRSLFVPQETDSDKGPHSWLIECKLYFNTELKK